ncbi:MAG: hypothetical protein DKM50_10570 [Candidatus Margulisiibacteriota bacterium]|nr:MAG: hypothetical protein A2X43_07035 [Candidatus Margulisbacteria bacterium GWD2_39_127]OGI02966.1 MAG: hypothetical protein A2X42_12800 [Candidatus Margulisbacteria bacterium GWF2_38_17]OGI09441.1 MAG: hypothetical protein A2X41_12445 [Candidatus Margulisbacteria bacterium GWE2_39_32]PZM78759.1 MAG: hypothetical protein DKM50_10570 [Candidatus Margulisiibacteriota bacterium]HAR63339.1 hypothetical protein [Candidatus Margulisiibacteriota bacterium]
MKIRIIKYATLATVLFILGFFSGNIYQLYKNYNYNLKIINYLQKEHKLLQHKNVSLKKLVSSFKKISGLADIQGAGIIIKVDEPISSNHAEKPKQPDNIVTDKDLQNIVTELWSFGAQAISINGNRLVINSVINNNNSIISINQNTVTPPYTINAVGERQQLYNSAGSDNGYLSFLKTKNVTVVITVQDNVIIPAYKGTLLLKSMKVQSN